MIRYKVDITKALSEKGYTSYRIAKEHILGNSTMQALRKNDINMKLSTFDKICSMLECDLTDLIEYVPGEPDQANQA